MRIWFRPVFPKFGEHPLTKISKKSNIILQNNQPVYVVNLYKYSGFSSLFNTEGYAQIQGLYRIWESPNFG